MRIKFKLLLIINIYTARFFTFEGLDLFGGPMSNSSLLLQVANGAASFLQTSNMCPHAIEKLNSCAGSFDRWIDPAMG